MNYRNARYIDDTRIDCEIEHPKFGWIPYTLDPADKDKTINNDDLLSAMLANGDVAAHVPPSQAELDAVVAAEVRSKRDGLIASTDWWALSDNTMTQAQIDYRQALRDIPQQAGFPHDVTWPTKPE